MELGIRGGFRILKGNSRVMQLRATIQQNSKAMPNDSVRGLEIDYRRLVGEFIKRIK